jgi:membrane associated rhomboid family serine protease
MVNGNEDVQKDMPKWVRGVAAAIGILLLGVMVLFLGGVAAELASGGSESWFTRVSVAFFAALTGVIGAQLVYFAVTGKRRGRLQRWLSAIRDAILDVHP